MSIILGKHDKRRLILWLANLCREYIYDHLAAAQTHAVEQHFATLRDGPDVNARFQFETKPELG